MLDAAEVMVLAVCAIIALLVVAAATCMWLLVRISRASVGYPELTSQVTVLARIFGRLMLDVATAVSIILRNQRLQEPAVEDKPIVKAESNVDNID
jgi:hypothetical protein